MTKIAITSNTHGKLKKIRDGDIFDDPTIFVAELIQNAYRARAKNIWFQFENDSLTVTDDGRGCKRPENILTLDLSEWDTTDEGFGIGFWSILAIPDLKRFMVASHKWSTNVETNNIFDNGDLLTSIDSLEHNPLDGFKIVMQSPHFMSFEHKWEIIDKIKSIGGLQPFNVYVDGERVRKRNLLDEVYGDFTKDFSTHKFTACLSVSNDYSSPVLYYEKRPVIDMYEIDFCEGVIEMRPKALNLKEPDRKSIIKNDKYYQFIEQIKKCVKELYIDFVKNSSEDLINEYAYSIDSVLSVKEYENYIMCAEEFTDVVTTTRTVSIHDERNSTFVQFMEFIDDVRKGISKSTVEWDEATQNQIAQLMNRMSPNGEWVCVGYTDDYQTDLINVNDLDVLTTIVIGNLKYDKIKFDNDDFAQDDEERSTCVINIPYVRTQRRNNSTVKSIAKKPGKKVWVTSNDLDELSDLKSRAEYYGIKVLISKNVLHENIYKHYGVPYITELRDGVVKRISKKNVELRTKKEEAFINILKPICSYFNLPYTTFKVGNLRLIVETRLDGRIIDREKMSIAAVTDGADIIFDRKILGLKRFHLYNENIGQHELKALMVNLDTISHELAHLIYHSEDNTVFHYKMQSHIQEEIVNLYLTL